MSVVRSIASIARASELAVVPNNHAENEKASSAKKETGDDHYILLRANKTISEFRSDDDSFCIAMKNCDRDSDCDCNGDCDSDGGCDIYKDGGCDKLSCMSDAYGCDIDKT